MLRRRHPGRRRNDDRHHQLPRFRDDAVLRLWRGLRNPGGRGAAGVDRRGRRQIPEESAPLRDHRLLRGRHDPHAAGHFLADPAGRADVDAVRDRHPVWQPDQQAWRPPGWPTRRRRPAASDAPVNLLLLEGADFIAADRVILRDRRLVHMQEVHRAVVGDNLRVGRIGGLMGNAQLLRLEAGEAELHVSFDQPPPTKL
ncbi:hypothetical protein ALP97_04719, partial [Pseudomonas salomonii]